MTILEITTSRLLLIGADDALLCAELTGTATLETATGAHVPSGWPPEHHDEAVIEWVRSSLAKIGPQDPWRFYYIVLRDPRTLVGTCGIKEAPDGRGSVELGYSVIEKFRRRGIATEAVTALIETAFAAGAREVAAVTYPTLPASIAVMEKCGLRAAGEGPEPGTVRYARTRLDERTDA